MHLCRIFKDLGFVKVAGLLDGDKSSDAESLGREFPDYFFSCIPAKDIRDKSEREATEAVAGLLDSKRVLKPEFTERMRALISLLSDHMNA